VSLPRRAAALLYAVAAGAFVLDRISKAWVEHALAGRPPIRVIPGILSLTFTTNSGGAFGLGRSAPWLFATATVAVSAAIVFASFRAMRPVAALSLGMILGGALGNLADRIANGSALSGPVTDFIDFHVWPVFNLADASIVIGAALLALASLERPEHGSEHRQERPAAQGSAATDEPER
jgi:signal peptidase II